MLVWKWHGIDKAGKPSPRSPYTSRGPATEAEMRLRGQQILNSMRQDAHDATGVDPEYKVSQVELIGEDDGEKPGQWRPRGAKPMPTPNADAADAPAAADGLAAHGLAPAPVKPQPPAPAK